MRIHTLGAQEELLQPVRTLAVARVFLAVSALLAIYLDPTEPTRFTAFAYSMMVFYVLYAIGALLAVRTVEHLPRWLPAAFHLTDLVWATSMSLLTEGPNSPFYMFFLFVLLAAAYRWGLPETILTAAVLALLLVAQAYVAVWGGGLLDVPVELNRLIMRSSYLMIMGLLLGFLAEAQKQTRIQTTITSTLLGRVKGETGLRGALQVVFNTLVSVFRARKALLFLEDTGSNRKYLWESRPLAGSEETLLRFEELQPAGYDFDALPRAPAWQATRSEKEAIRVVVPGRAGKHWRQLAEGPRQPLAEGWTFRHALGVVVAFGADWRGHLLILDPQFGEARPGELRFLSQLVRELEPVLYSVYLYRRLRSRAGAIERARVARELHDGVIQSLVSLELQMEALRGTANGYPMQLTTELQNIQLQLHQEVLAVRELMDQMRAAPVGPRELLDYLVDRVDRFRRDTGIAARFVTDLEEVQMPARTSRELARIVQEGLVNIRKHSGARNATVHFTARNGHWTLTIQDDGKGMDFAGSRSLSELEAMRAGPTVIRERVRSIGGELTIHSNPHSGCRLEITISQRSHG